MKKQEFESMVNKAKDLGYDKICIALNVISGHGGYSSGQFNIDTEISKIDISSFLTIYAPRTRRESYSIFDTVDIVSGGEPIMVTYSDILCVIGIKNNVSVK